MDEQDEQLEIIGVEQSRKLPGAMKTAEIIERLKRPAAGVNVLTILQTQGAICLELVEKTKLLARGDLSSLESMLLLQAEVLNATFLKWLDEANKQILPEQAERCMNMAMRCQSQSRKALATLAEIKNPKRSTFIKQQLNQLHVDPQPQVKQLEPTTYAALDTGGTSTPIRINQAAAALEA